MSDPILESPALQPLDEYNRALAENVHPPEWTNPEPAGRYNLVVVGAGTAGLVSAIDRGDARRGQTVLSASVGGGMSWGAALWTL